MKMTVPLLVCSLVACGEDAKPSGEKTAGASGSGMTNAGGGNSGSGGSSGGAQGGGAGSDTISPGGVTVAIQPKSIALRPGGKQQFSCSVTGAPSMDCTWKVQESVGGEVTAAGLYTAPDATGVFHVIAASSDDPAAMATATVTVTDKQSGSCDDLPAAGTWENITPAQLDPGNWCVPGGACSDGQLGTYGTNSFVIDPNNSGTVYLGTASLGIWKTTDCGSTWEKINTGSNAEAIDMGRNWSMIIDPADSQTLYTVTGYAGAGFYKSTDGGVNWEQKFSEQMLAMFPGQGIEKLSMDPTNNLHLTATFHNPCLDNPNGGGDWPCIAETMDGGETFTLTNSAQFWSEGDGQTMLDETTWFFSNGGGQIWRTTDAGETWDFVHDRFDNGEYNTSGCIYIATDGTLYTGGSRGMARSTDRGETWQALDGAPQIGGPNGNCPMVDDGTNLYVSMGLIAYDPPATDWFHVGTGDPPSGWTGMNNPPVVTGGLSLQIDTDHNLLYSSNSTGGFYRVVLK